MNEFITLTPRRFVRNGYTIDQLAEVAALCRVELAKKEKELADGRRRISLLWQAIDTWTDHATASVIREWFAAQTED
jgi:hypothetical protein